MAKEQFVSVKENGFFLFAIEGDRQEMIEWVTNHAPSTEEKPDGLSEEEMSEEDQKAVLAFLDPGLDWAPYIAKIRRKKDGTFYRNSVLSLYAIRSMGYESEDYFGFRYPELRLKATGDRYATVEIIWTVDKY